LQFLFCICHIEQFIENPYYHKEILWQVSQTASGLLLTAWRYWFKKWRCTNFKQRIQQLYEVYDEHQYFATRVLKNPRVM